MIAKNQNLKFNNFYLLVLFYLSLIIGFYFGEDLNFGASGDWGGTNHLVITQLSLDLKETLLNYEIYNHRHSPIYLTFLSFFLKIGFSYDLIRFLHLNLSLLLVYFFYKCLILKFSSVDKKLLLILSLSIFLSPTFRSLSIWPDTRIIGLTFFVLAIYEFLKFQKKPLKKYLFKNFTYLVISSYISPNFSVFIIYFFYHYIKKTDLETLTLIVFFSIIFALPAFYYLFILEVNFLAGATPGVNEGETIGLNFNFSNKILIISSIILFHLIPFIINRIFVIDFFKSLKKNIPIVTIIFVINIIFFDYLFRFTGGGFFFQISTVLFQNNLIFYFFSFLSLLLLAYFIRDNFNNFLIFILLIISNIQNTIYHKYYDPLVLVLFFTILNTNFSSSFFKKKYNVFYVYAFYLIFIFMRILKNNGFI